MIPPATTYAPNTGALVVTGTRYLTRGESNPQRQLFARIDRDWAAATEKSRQKILELTRRWWVAELNELRRLTLPNTPFKTSARGASPAPDRLRNRIIGNITGTYTADIATAIKQFARAIPGNTGPVQRWGMPYAHGSATKNLYILADGTSRRRNRTATTPPTTDALAWITANTTFGLNRSRAYTQRNMTPGAPVAYTTAASLRSAINRLTRRVGNWLSGWAPAARALGASNLRQFFPGAPRDESGSFDLIHTGGSASGWSWTVILANTTTYTGGNYPRWVARFLSEFEGLSDRAARPYIAQYEKIIADNLRTITT